MSDLDSVTGAPAPQEFGELSAEHRSELTALVEKAARERSDLIDHSIEDSLRYLPALLRGPVKRALGM